MNGPMFLGYVDQCVVLTLKRGDVVAMESLAVNEVTGSQQSMETARAGLRYLPTYSPELNPVEMAFANRGRFCMRRLSAKFSS